MLEDKEKDKITNYYGDYYWEQINKLDEFYNKNLEERLREIKEKDQRIAELEKQLDQANERLPKFKKDDYVYALFTQTEIYKGQIDAFDYYTNSYLIYPNEDIGNEWIKADKVFKTKLEAEKKLQELRGGE